MGLFDKFSKKNKNSVDELAEKADKLIGNDSQEQKTEAEEKQEVSSAEETVSADVETDTNDKEDDAEEVKPDEIKKSSDNKGRRFTILVEDAFQMKDDQGVVAGGNVHGTIKLHDKVYIIHPLLPEGVEAEIDGIEEGPMNMVEEATDSRVGVKFSSIKDRNKLPRFSVITNVRPVLRPDAQHPAESPFLVGLTYEYNRLIKDQAFQNIFTFAVFSGRYITPVKLEVDMNKTTERRAVVKEGSKVSFKLLRHPGDENLRVLPVFTDMGALGLWKDAYEGSEQPQNFFMPFEQCADIALKNGGMVINAWGPVPVFVSNENINLILKMKADLDKKISEEQNGNK